MTARHEDQAGVTLKDQFAANSGTTEARRKLRTSSPFSIRFSDGEREWLNREAGTLSLAAHIRLKLFGTSASAKDRRKPSRKPQRPTIDRAVLAKALGELGKSRLASNMNQIAKLANMGALPVGDELLEDLKTACADIRAIRSALIAALGITPEDGS